MSMHDIEKVIDKKSREGSAYVIATVVRTEAPTSAGSS